MRDRWNRSTTVVIWRRWRLVRPARELVRVAAHLFQRFRPEPARRIIILQHEPILLHGERFDKRVDAAMQALAEEWRDFTESIAVIPLIRSIGLGKYLNEEVVAPTRHFQ